ncbi:MBL fold metallo-hydrolase [Rhodosalinus halophilus]|uniref:MBL fold metallo-hydrolase n=1 Tax=Rhodosalinus halophilus TaxID=2259333 RepID=A0A365U9Z9_9RHOB|nr:MBL fold metallo-hydrolase [Rhodosalinus halophilus]RBI84913.1 MBL fold metallo-hydrolase [Rhodosalinus halophilus]
MTQQQTGPEAPRAGVPVTLAPGLRRILAPNPSPMTFWGTNTYLLGQRGLAVIDPGPDQPAHLEAILDALRPEQHITHILVTHAHLDHAPLARRLSDATGAPVLAFGDARSGRSAVMRRLAAEGLAGGGEGVDAGFAPDIALADAAEVEGDGWRLAALHTPGHFGNHMCFAWREAEALFTGDLVMGWASSLVSPPDGDLTDFMASCARLASVRWQSFHPGHGAPVEDPAARLDWLIAHRRSREAQIRAALAEAPGSPDALARRIYADTPPALLPAAARNVFAHLVDLAGRGLVRPAGPLSAEAEFHPTGAA